MTLHILRTPMREHSRESVGIKWCFHCRAHLPHDWVVHVPTDAMSYYGPTGSYECSRCHRDHTLFPGTCFE